MADLLQRYAAFVAVHPHADAAESDGGTARAPIAVTDGETVLATRRVHVMQATATYENIHSDESPVSDTANEAIIAPGTRRRRFVGEIAGEGTVDVRIAHGTSDQLGYVATERFVGSVQGRSGSFLLQHGAAIDRDAMTPFGYIVPGSGRGELAGIRGDVRMTMETPTLSYDLEC